MGASSRETEIKLRFGSPSEAFERLRNVGARAVRSREFEDNILFDHPADPLAPTGRLLRLRRVGKGAVLTFKAPVFEDSPHKVRVEHETPIERPDDLERILTGIGYVATYRYQKYRSVFELDGVEVSVDETPIGCYLELEGDPAGIDRVAARLGFTEDAYIRDSYRDLHETWALAHRIPAGDLLMGGAMPVTKP